MAVQETTPANIRSYAERYDIDYTVGFDASADIFHTYQVGAADVVLHRRARLSSEVAAVMPDEQSARDRIEAWLPKAGT